METNTFPSTNTVTPGAGPAMPAGNDSNANKGASSNREKLTFIFSAVTACCTVLICLVLVVSAFIVVPKAVKLIGSAQVAVENINEVSEELSKLKIEEAISNIEDSTTQAMSDVSDSMEKIESLDVDTLNESIQDLKKTTDAFKKLFGR